MPVQAKVAIGRPNDPYERQADAVADRVMSGRPAPAITPLPAGGLSSTAQRQAMDEEPVQEMAVQHQEDEEPVQEAVVQRQEEDEPVQEMAVQRQEEEESVQEMAIQRQEEEEPVQEQTLQRQEENEPVQEAAVQRQEEEEPVQEMAVQRQEDDESVQMRSQNAASRHDMASMQAVAARAIHAKGAGDPLDPMTRHTLERSLGVDLSGVRVHTGSQAHEAAGVLSARAFTHKNDIWLGRGVSQHDTRLMAHEATHVVQQNAAPQHHAAGGPSVQRTESDGPAIVQRDLWSDITGAAGAVWDATGGQVVDAAGAALEMGADFFWSMLQRLAPDLVPILRQISSKGIVGFLYDTIKGTVSGIFDKLNVDSSALTAVVALFTALLARAGDIVTALVGGDCKPLLAAVQSLKDTVSQLAGDAWNAITAFFKPVGDFFTNLWASFGAPLVDWLSETAGAVWEYIKGLGTQIWDWTQPVRDTLGAAWTWVKEQLGIGESEASAESGGGLVDWVTTKAAEAWGSIKEQLQPVIAPIQAVVEKVKAVLPLDAILDLRETITGWLDNVGQMSASLEAEDGAAENQASLREEILPAVLRTIESVRGALTNAGLWVATQIGAVAVTVQGLYGSLRSNPILGTLAGAQLQWLSDAVGTLAGWAQQGVVGVFTLYSEALGLLSRFVEPVLNVLQKVVEVLGNIAGKLPDLILGPVWWLMPKCIKDPIKDFLLNTILAQIPIFNQLLVIPDIWAKVKSTAMEILTKVFVNGDLIGAAWTYFKAILSLIGIPPELVVSIVKHAVTALSDILKDPIGFLLNILKAIKQGFVQFFGNILKHLYNGVVDWLFGAVSEAGLTPPADFSLKSVLDFVLQVLDITRERILDRMEKHPKIGKKVVDKLRTGFEIAEGAWEWVKMLFTEGPAGIWRMVQEKLSSLWTTVIGSIVSWMSAKIIEQATIKLLSFIDPSFIMAFVNSVIFIYKAIQSFVQYINEMLEIVNSVFAGIGAIAKGSIGQAANFLEQTLADSIPIVIGFLANQFGLGQISRRIGDMVESVRETVNGAIDWLIDKAVTVGAAFLNMLKSGAAAVKEGVAGVLAWWREKRAFVDNTGESHTLYFEGEGKSASLMVATTPTTIRRLIDQLASIVSSQTDERYHTAYTQLSGNIDEIESKERILADQSDEANRQTHYENLTGLINESTEPLKILMPLLTTTENFPEAVLPAFTQNVKAGSFKALNISRDKTKTPPGEESDKNNGATLPGWIELEQKSITIPPEKRDRLIQNNRKRAERGEETIPIPTTVTVREGYDYVKTHLLHARLGGKATDSNLTPTRSGVNNRFESMESKAEAGVNSSRVIWYEVSIGYYERTEPIPSLPGDLNYLTADLYPKELHAKYGYMEKETTGGVNKWTYNSEQQGTFDETNIPLPIFDGAFPRKYFPNRESLLGATHQGASITPEFAMFIDSERNAPSVRHKGPPAYQDLTEMLERLKNRHTIRITPATEGIRKGKAYGDPVPGFNQGIILLQCLAAEGRLDFSS